MNKSICKTDADGDKRWYLDGKLHRADGPAIEAVEYADGYKAWFLDGKLHRADGPAIEYTNGDKIWYLDDKQIDCKSQEEFERLLRLKAFW